MIERNGWFVAFEKAIEEAKASKEGITTSESYKEELEKLRKFYSFFLHDASRRETMLHSLVPVAQPH